MILKLHNKQIIIKANEYPEDIENAKVSYEFELGTNHLKPILYIGTDVYVGNKITIPFKYTSPDIHMYVELRDGNGTVIKSYQCDTHLYRTFTLGSNSHINIYKELLRIQEQLKELEEKGDVI